MSKSIYGAAIGAVLLISITMVLVGQLHLISRTKKIGKYNCTDFNATDSEPCIPYMNNSTNATDFETIIDANFSLLIGKMEDMHPNMFEINVDDKDLEQMSNITASISPNVNKFGNCDNLSHEETSYPESSYFSDLTDDDEIDDEEIVNNTEDNNIEESEGDNEILDFDDEVDFDEDAKKARDYYQDDLETNTDKVENITQNVISNNSMILELENNTTPKSFIHLLPGNDESTHQNDSKAMLNSHAVTEGHNHSSENKPSPTKILIKRESIKRELDDIENSNKEVQHDHKRIYSKPPLIEDLESHQNITSIEPIKDSTNLETVADNIKHSNTNQDISENEEEELYINLSDLLLIQRSNGTISTNTIKKIQQERYENAKRLMNNLNRKYPYKTQKEFFLSKIISSEDCPRVIQRGIKIQKDAKCVLLYQNRIIKVVILASDSDYYNKIEGHITRMDQFIAKIKRWYEDYKNILDSEQNSSIYESTIMNIRHFIQNDLGYNLKRDQSIIDMSCNEFENERKMVYVVFYYKDRGGEIKNPKLLVKLAAEKTEIN